MIEIACAADRAFWPRVATMLTSALDHAGERPRIHVLAGGGLSYRERRRMVLMLEERGAEATIHRMRDETFEGLRATGPFPVVVWYRTALAETLADVDRVLYLDSDLLVLDSLEPLWETELGDNLVGAVTNVFPDRELAGRHCEALGIEPSRYFNSGVLLLDLAGMRTERSSERIRDFARRHAERIVFPDQDALNGALGERRLALDPRWNLLLGAEHHPGEVPGTERQAIEAAIAHPAIRHFEGAANKPWRRSAPAWARELWRQHRDRTPWAKPGATRT